MTAALKIVPLEESDLGIRLPEVTRKLYTINLYNTDDALTQGKWAEFQKDVKCIVVGEETALVHGVWYTSPGLYYQSMSISFNLTGDFPEMAARTIKGCLSGLSEEYAGCTVQWTEAVVSYI